MSEIHQEPLDRAGVFDGREAQARVDAQAAAWSGGIARGDHGALGSFYAAWFDRCVQLARLIRTRGGMMTQMQLAGTEPTLEVVETRSPM